jgi:HD-like signal output (HDOD) protein
MKIDTIVQQSTHLPLIPKVVQQIIASFNSDRISVGEIALQIGADPVLSAKVLRLANSSYFNMSRTIATLDDALHILGFSMVRNLVLGDGMAAAYRNTPGMDLHAFWRHNLYTACTSRWLAEHSNQNGDLMFTLGLLHGIGQLQMHCAAPSAMVAIDSQIGVLDRARCRLETDTLGFHFCEVSAALARIWKFPPTIIDALAAVPDPLGAAQWTPAAALVHLGTWRARVEQSGELPADWLHSYPGAIATRLGLGSDWVSAQQGSPGRIALPLMPDLRNLTHGLEDLMH